MSTLGDFSTVCDAQNMEYLDYKPSDGKVAFSCGGVDFYIYNYVSKTIVGNQRTSASVTSITAIEESKYFVIGTATKLFFYDANQVASTPSVVQNELKKEYITNGASSIKYSILDGVLIYSTSPLS